MNKVLINLTVFSKGMPSANGLPKRPVNLRPLKRHLPFIIKLLTSQAWSLAVI
ncbi:hypothetical protein BMS3Abin03_02636 [bacterium BMS3Abin03]|nr:hypothetical protein BMS3Abin03_02636 [bacterium BMS3Abin03]